MGSSPIRRPTHPMARFKKVIRGEVSGYARALRDVEELLCHHSDEITFKMVTGAKKKFFRAIKKLQEELSSFAIDVPESNRHTVHTDEPLIEATQRWSLTILKQLNEQHSIIATPADAST